MGRHTVDGLCTIGHKLSKSLIACETCGQLVSYADGLHVNSRNKHALLKEHGMFWTQYNLEDWRKILAGRWDHNKYPWEKQNA